MSIHDDTLSPLNPKRITVNVLLFSKITLLPSFVIILVANVVLCPFFTAVGGLALGKQFIINRRMWASYLMGQFL